MSLIYDKNVAYKPGNVSKMFLDNAGFKQQQDNINNHENAQKLDVSALSAQEEINGTECVGLLLEHWKDVAGAGNNFRDFATGVVAPTLYKEQMSVNEIDEETAKSIATDINNPKNNAKASWATDLLGAVIGPAAGNIYMLTEAAQTINHAFTYGAKDFLGIDLKKIFHTIGSGLALTPPSVDDIFGNGIGVADPFDDFGLYGGDQGGIDQSINFFWTGWIIGENDDIYDFVRSHKGYENYSDKAVHDLLSELEGEGCTYVAMANAIFGQYRDQGDLFEKKLGFPILGEDGDLNYKKLIIDLYLNTKNKIYLDDPNGQEYFAAYYYNHIDEFRKTFNQYYEVDENGHYIPKFGYSEIQWINQAYENLKEKGVTEITTDDDFTCSDAAFNRLAHYSKEKNLDIVVKDGGEELDNQKIKEALDNGYNIVVGLDKFKLQFEEGTQFMLGRQFKNHEVTITGIAPDGRYIVSSWGTKLYLDPKDAEVDGILHIKREPQTNPGINNQQPQMNLLNPMQGKMALNINVADQENADSIAYYISKEQTPGTGGFRKNSGFDIPLPTLPDAEDHVYVGNEPFDQYGSFGGSQKDMGTGTDFWIFGIAWEDEDLYDFVRKHKGYENYSNKQIHDLLEEVEDKGCTFVALANSIFERYRNRPEEFESKLHFPMIGKNGDLNYRFLIMDIILETGFKLYTDDPSGEEPLGLYFKYFPDEMKKLNLYDKNKSVQDNAAEAAHRIITGDYPMKEISIKELTGYSGALCNRGLHYFKEKDLDMDMFRLDDKSKPSLENIKEQLKKGRIVTCSLVSYNLEDKDGNVIYDTVSENSGHAVSIVGVTDDGRYIISSHGKMHYLNLNKQKDSFEIHHYYSIGRTPLKVYGDYGMTDPYHSKRTKIWEVTEPAPVMGAQNAGNELGGVLNKPGVVIPQNN